MKRLALAVLLIMICSAYSPAFAVDFILGAKAGYYVWGPYFRDMTMSGIEDIDSGSGVLYGPVISVLFLL